MKLTRWAIMPIVLGVAALGAACGAGDPLPEEEPGMDPMEEPGADPMEEPPGADPMEEPMDPMEPDAPDAP